MGITFGKALQEIRELKGCSRTDLARQIEIRAEGIKKYEDEQVNITVKKAVELANVLKCGFGWDKKDFFFYPLWEKSNQQESNFADNLRDARAMRGYSQKALSEKTGINVSTISKYEMGKTVPTIKNVIKIAESLKCTFGWNGNEFWFSQHKSKKKKERRTNLYDYLLDQMDLVNDCDWHRDWSYCNNMCCRNFSKETGKKEMLKQKCIGEIKY